MKKSVAIRALCLVVASVVLSGAVAAAAFMGSPYEILKRAILDGMSSLNATVEGQMTVTVDGEIQQTQKSYVISGDDGYLNYYFDENGDQSGYYYSANGLEILPSYTAEDGTQWYFANVVPKDNVNVYRGGGSALIGPGMITSETRNSAQMRFIELAIDLLVGDLKNNITMSSDDGIRKIHGTLTESQIPELAKAGIDMLVEQSSGGYYWDQREISLNGNERVYEDIRITNGEKTITTWKQSIRPMTSEEKKAWENGTYNIQTYDNDGYFDVVFINDHPYALTEPPERISEKTVPAVRADYENRGPLDIPMKSLTVNYLHGEAEVDADGNLLYIDVGGSATLTDIFGETSEVEIRADARFSDIGASNFACPIPGAEQLLTPDYMKAHFGIEYYVGLYFTLNPDGSINADSVTTTYPGEFS